MLQSINTMKAIHASDNNVIPASLPLDIWIEIAILLANEEHFRHVVPLLTVCKQLRSALHQTHKLWTNLDFNYRDQPNNRSFPVPNRESIELFLNNLPPSSVQTIRWRPSDSKSMALIIRFALHKFDSIVQLDIRPHLGDSTSEYLLATCTALEELTEKGIVRKNFRKMLIANTSFRQEPIRRDDDVELMATVQQVLHCLTNLQNEQDESQPIENEDKKKYHDLAFCEMCDSQFAHTSGKRTCILPCNDKEFNVCLSCTEYCSICDAQVCPDHPDFYHTLTEEFFLEGRCYHGDGEMLRYCVEHEDTNLCDVCQLAQCEHHLQTCANRQGGGLCQSGSKICIDCCLQCPDCNNWYCEECFMSEHHEVLHQKSGHPDLDTLIETFFSNLVKH